MRQKTEATIIPALPGYFLVAVYRDEKKVEVSLPVVAWRVETWRVNHKDPFNVQYSSSMYPISANGDACSNEVGVLHPNGVIVHSDGWSDSLEEMQNELFPPEVQKVDSTRALG